MWGYKRLSLSSELTKVNAAVNVAHPWIYGLGQQTENGDYLSPVNAITYLAGKLIASGESAEAVVILVAGDSQENFLERLTEITDVIALPALTQVMRLSASAASLAVEKMQIPAPLASFSPGAPFSTASTRAAMNARLISDARNAASAGFSQDAVKEAMRDFAQARESALKSIADEAEALLGKTTTAWVFSGQDGAVNNAAKLVKDIPLGSYVHCAAVMFTGDDLTGIRGMVHEYESNTGT